MLIVDLRTFESFKEETKNGRLKTMYDEQLEILSDETLEPFFKSKEEEIQYYTYNNSDEQISIWLELGKIYFLKVKENSIKVISTDIEEMKNKTKKKYIKYENKMNLLNTL